MLYNVIGAVCHAFGAVCHVIGAVCYVIGAVLLVIGAVCHVIGVNLKLKSNENKQHLYKLFMLHSIFVLSLN